MQESTLTRSSGRSSFDTQLERHESLSIRDLREFCQKFCKLKKCLLHDDFGARMAVLVAMSELWSRFNGVQRQIGKGQALLDYMWANWEPAPAGRKLKKILWRLPGYATGTVCQKCWGFAAGFIDLNSGNMNATFFAVLAKFHKGVRSAVEQKVIGSKAVDSRCNKQDRVLRFLKEWVVDAQDHIPEDVADEYNQAAGEPLAKKGRVHELWLTKVTSVGCRSMWTSHPSARFGICVVLP